MPLCPASNDPVINRQNVNPSIFKEDGPENRRVHRLPLFASEMSVPPDPLVDEKLSAGDADKRQDDALADTIAHDDFPDGGLRAWLVIFGVRSPLSFTLIICLRFADSRLCVIHLRRKDYFAFRMTNPQVVGVLSRTVQGLIFLFLVL